MTLRQLWRMAQGRREELRKHAIAQAALVWSLGEMTGEGIEEFVKRGEIFTRQECPMPHMPEVDKKVAEIMANGGKLCLP